MKKFVFIISVCFSNLYYMNANNLTTNCILKKRPKKEITINIGTEFPINNNTSTQIYSLRYSKNAFFNLARLGFTASYMDYSGEFTNSSFLIANAFTQVKIFKTFYVEYGVGGITTVSSLRANEGLAKLRTHFAFGEKLKIYKNYFVDMQYQYAVTHNVETFSGRQNLSSHNLILGLGLKF